MVLPIRTRPDLVGAISDTTILPVGIPTDDLAYKVSAIRFAQYVGSRLQTKAPVRLKTVGNHTLSGLDPIDGVTPEAGERIFVASQTAAQTNGIYNAAVGGWLRSTDANTWDSLVGAEVVVIEGTAGGDTKWLSTINPGGTLETTPITWTQQFGALLWQPRHARLSALASVVGVPGHSPYYTAASKFSSAPMRRLLFASGSPILHTGTTSLTALVTQTIPGGSLGTNGLLEVIAWWTYTSSAASKLFRITYGGTTFANVNGTTQVYLRQTATIGAANSATAQYSAPSNFIAVNGSSSVAPIYAAIDTTINQSVVISASNTDTAETIRLERYEIWVTQV